MDFLDVLVINLGLGGAAIIVAIIGFIRGWNPPDMVRSLILGAALVALGLLNLLGLMGAAWTDISTNMFIGVVILFGSIAALCSPPSSRYPRWTQLAGLGLGIYVLLQATKGILK